MRLVRPDRPTFGLSDSQPAAHQRLVVRPRSLSGVAYAGALIPLGTQPRRLLPAAPGPVRTHGWVRSAGSRCSTSLGA